MPIGIGLGLAASGLFGAGASIFGASSQVSAEQAAIQAMEQLYQQGLTTQRNYVGQAEGALSPFISGGQNALEWYNYLTGTSSAVPGATGASGTLGAPGGSAGPVRTGPNGDVWRDPNAAAAAGATPTPAQTVTGPGGQPITIGGSNSFNPLNAPLTAPFNAGMLPYTPGYQWQLGQGTGAALNAAAAEGYGGTSGPSLKAVIDYSQGLAGSTYNQQFANYLTQNQQIANILLGSAGVGAGAAGTLGSIFGSAGNAALGGAVNTGTGIGSATAGIGNALAGGAAGVAGSLGGSLLQYALLNKLTSPSTVPAGIPANTYASNALASSGTPFNSFGIPNNLPGTFGFPTG